MYTYMVEDLVWIRRLVFEVSPGSRHSLKYIRSWVENECRCPCTVGISNVDFTNIYAYTYSQVHTHIHIHMYRYVSAHCEDCSITLPDNSLEHFLWRENLVLLTAKWIVFAVIDFGTYGPNLCTWPEWIRWGISLRIHFMQLWTSRSIRSQSGWSAEGANGFRFTRIPSVKTTFWSEFCKVQTMPCHTSGEVLQLIVRLSR